MATHPIMKGIEKQKRRKAKIDKKAAAEALRKRESDAINFLRDERSYGFMRIKRKDERYSSLFSFNGGKTVSYRNAIGVRLFVPEDSVLGAMIVEMYKEIDKPKTKKKAAKR